MFMEVAEIYISFMNYLLSKVIATYLKNVAKILLQST